MLAGSWGGVTSVKPQVTGQVVPEAPTNINEICETRSAECMAACAKAAACQADVSLPNCAGYMACSILGSLVTTKAGATTTATNLVFKGNSATNLGLCEGGCVHDKDCQDGFECQPRDEAVVRGCQAGGTGDKSSYKYCAQGTARTRNVGW